jgi:hypothetical protein
VRGLVCCSWCSEGTSKGLALINGQRSHQLSGSGSEWSGLARQATISTGIALHYSRLFELLLVGTARPGKRRPDLTPTSFSTASRMGRAPNFG